MESHAELLEPSAATFAVLGDYVPMGISFIQQGKAGSTSLDNTLRVIDLVPSDWYLLDIRVDAIASGFGHGVIHIWSEDGTLCAIGSQSCIVRSREPGSHSHQNVLLSHLISLNKIRLDYFSE